jgi:hypothetical protein
MFALGYYVANITRKNDVEIKTVKVTRNKIYQNARNDSRSFRLRTIPITIQTQAEGNTIIITASDDCKEAQAFIDTECKIKRKQSFIRWRWICCWRCIIFVTIGIYI